MSCIIKKPVQRRVWNLIFFLFLFFKKSCNDLKNLRTVDRNPLFYSHFLTILTKNFVNFVKNLWKLLITMSLNSGKIQLKSFLNFVSSTQLSRFKVLWAFVWFSLFLFTISVFFMQFFCQFCVARFTSINIGVFQPFGSFWWQIFCSICQISALFPAKKLEVGFCSSICLNLQH